MMMGEMPKSLGWLIDLFASSLEKTHNRRSFVHAPLRLRLRAFVQADESDVPGMDGWSDTITESHERLRAFVQANVRVQSIVIRGGSKKLRH